MFLKNNLGKIELCFLVKKIIFVFDELNLRSYFLDYDFKIFKLWFKIYLMLSMLFEEYWSELLLVNNLYNDNILIVILLIYIKNKRGFNIDFWGIFVEIFDVFDKRFLYIIFWDFWFK